MRALTALAVGCVLVLLGIPAHAHNGSYDMKYVDGSNLILLTFNTHEPASGLAIEHNLRLYDLVGAPIPYDEVRIEMYTQEQSDEPVALRSPLLHDETLPMLPTNESKLTYTYPGPGAHTLVAEFVADGRPISRAEFAVDVGQGTPSASGFGLWPLAGGFLGGVAITLLLVRRGPRTTGTPSLESSAAQRTSAPKPAGPAPAGAGRG